MVPLSRPGDHFQSEKGVTFVREEGGHFPSEFPPHTEDDKISKRTKDGIHEHLMNGEWCGIAPRGYKNVRKSRSECHIEVDEQNAELIRKVFREVAKGIEKPNTTNQKGFQRSC